MKRRRRHSKPTRFRPSFEVLETRRLLAADLDISKSVSDTTPTTNQNVTFTISVTNKGPDNTAGVVISDQLPGGISYVNDSPSLGDYDPGTGLWTVGTLNNGSTATLSIIGRVTGVGTITNTASVFDSDESDPVSENDIATATITPQTIDLAVTKQVNISSPNIGDAVTFTITVFNAGPSNATGVTIRDILPSGLSYVGDTPSQGDYSNASGIWNVGNINAGNMATLTIVAIATANGTLTNTATVISADQTDTNSSNDQGTANVSPAVADLELNKSVNPAIANVGDNVTFTITVTNSGPNAATGVNVTDVLPDGMSYISSNPSQGDYDPFSGVWTIGNISVGATQLLNITARIDSVGAKTNVAQVSASDQTDNDSSPGNNQSGEDDQDSAVVTPTSADLSLNKQVSKENPNVGETVNFTLTLSNAGPDTASGIVVLDQIPQGMTFVSHTATEGVYNSGTGRWIVGSLASGNSETLAIVARVDSTTSITNSARVEDVDQFDPDSSPGNDSPAEDDQDSVTIVPTSADLSLTKIVNDANPSVGDQVTFTITVTNSGPNGATGVTVLDELPNSTSYVSQTPSQGNYDPGTGVWEVGSIAVGRSATLNLVARANTTGLAENTAQIMTSDQRDPNSLPGNNRPDEDDQASAEISPQQIDLELSKTVSNTSPNVGTEVTFLITVVNEGPNTATGVMVTESLPSGVTLLRSTPSQGGFNLSTGVWNVGTLSANNSATISLLARVDDPGTGTNTAQVTAADQFDPDSTPGNNDEDEDDQASITFRTPIADLSLRKSVSNSSPNVGDMISFDVAVTNNGPDNASGVTVIDALANGLTYISNNLSAGSYDPGTGVWTIGGLADDATATLEIIARVDSQGQKSNTARVLTSDQSDPNSTPGNNEDSENDQQTISLVPAIADLSLTNVASPSRPAIDSLVTFTLTLTNDGPDQATNINVSDVLPLGLTFVDAAATSGSYNDTRGVWSVASVAANESEELEITARVNTPGDKSNTAEIVAVDQFDDDSRPDNGDSNEDDQATVVITPASADLELRKTADDVTPNVGQTVTYTVTIENKGPDTAENVQVHDTLPDGVTFLSATESQGSYNTSSRVWTIPILAANSTETLDIRVMVDTPGDKTNSAEVIASSQRDPDSMPNNNDPNEDDQASALLSPELVDLALQKSLDNTLPNMGDTITYMLELTNEGPTAATGVEVTDRLPSTIDILSAIPTIGTYSRSTGVWNVGTVAVGATPKLTITATVGDTRGESNTAEVTAVDQPDVDSDPNNNDPIEDDQSTVSFTTQVADLSLQKTVDTANPNMTETVTFTISVSNDGPDDATDVVVLDQLPSGFRYESDSPSVGNYDPTSGLWTIPVIPDGSAAILRIEAAVTSATPSSNAAEVLSSRQIDTDSEPGNNNPNEDDFDEAGVTPQVIDVSVSGTASDAEPSTGDVVQIVFTALNSGTAGASNLSLRSLVPAGLALVSSQPQLGTTYDSVSGQWDVGNLASGASATLTLNVRVDERGVKRVPIEVISHDEFDLDSSPDNGIPTEDDRTEVEIRAPRRLVARLFLSR